MRAYGQASGQAGASDLARDTNSRSRLGGRGRQRRQRSSTTRRMGPESAAQQTRFHDGSAYRTRRLRVAAIRSELRGLAARGHRSGSPRTGRPSLRDERLRVIPLAGQGPTWPDYSREFRSSATPATLPKRASLATRALRAEIRAAMSETPPASATGLRCRISPYLVKSGAAALRRGGASRAALSLGGPLARARRPTRTDAFRSAVLTGAPGLALRRVRPSLAIVQFVASVSRAALRAVACDRLRRPWTRRPRPRISHL